MDQGKDEVTESPADIRKAIAAARSELGKHLSALSVPAFHAQIPEDPAVPDPKKPKSTTAKNAQAKGAKGASGPKAKSSHPESAKKQTVAPKKTKSLSDKAGAGALKAAALAIEETEKNPRSGKRAVAASTTELHGEIAPEAAPAAIVRASKAVPPAEEKPRPVKAKGGKAKKG